MTEQTIPQERKPGIPTWGRIVLFFIAWMIFTGIFQVIGMAILGISTYDLEGLKNLSPKENLILQTLSFAALMLVVYIFRKNVDRKSIKSLGFSLKNRIPDLIAGLVVAVVILGIGSIILSLMGYVQFSFDQVDLTAVGVSFLLFTIVSFNEEIMIRGYVLNNMMSSMNKYLALFLSSLIFSVMHGLNSDVTWLSMINLLIAGILLGSAYIFTKNLWFPLSLHLFWNFIQGPIMGYNVSGHENITIFETTTQGARILHGGKFGFEGSIICTILNVIAIGLVIYYYNKRSKQTN